jgi:hypothetical protein
MADPKFRSDGNTGRVEVKETTCYMCACRCGIRVHLRDGEIRYIEGNPNQCGNRQTSRQRANARTGRRLAHYQPRRLNQWTGGTLPGVERIMSAQEDQAWLDYRARFAEIYDDANYANNLQSWVMHAGHRHSEKRFKTCDYFKRVLEIGAGTGEHLPFVRHGFDQYVMTDLDNNALDVARQKNGKTHGDKLLFETQHLEGLSYSESSFDRLIATHVLEGGFKFEVQRRCLDD